MKKISIFGILCIVALSMTIACQSVRVIPYTQGDVDKAYQAKDVETLEKIANHKVTPGTIKSSAHGRLAVLKYDKKHGGNIRAAMKDGCLFRALTVRQYSIGGGKWSSPQYIARPGYTRGAYRFVKCSSWYGSDRIGNALSGAKISKRMLEGACGRSDVNLLKGTKIYVRTAKNAQWHVYSEKKWPHKTVRDIEIGCFAKSSLNNRCSCK